jgi:hypothetical protein
MIRNLPLLSIALLLCGTIYGQSIRILDHDNNVNSTSGTITHLNWVDGTSTVNVDIANLSGTSRVIGLKRYEVNVVGGTENYVCIPGLCYASVQAGVNVFWTAPDDVNFVSDSADLQLYSLYHDSNGKGGTSTYRYVFFDVANTDDSAYVDVIYETPLTIEESKLNETSLEVYPNPAFDEINVNISEVSNNRLVIVDMLGSIVRNERLSQINSSINVSDLNAGVYFYSLMANNRQVGQSKRLVIK